MGDQRSKYDLKAFVRAAQEADLDQGAEHGTCHFSAVNVKDWNAIQKRLAAVQPGSVAGEGEEG